MSIHSISASDAANWKQDQNIQLSFDSNARTRDVADEERHHSLIEKHGVTFEPPDEGFKAWACVVGMFCSNSPHLDISMRKPPTKCTQETQISLIITRWGFPNTTIKKFLLKIVLHRHWPESQLSKFSYYSCLVQQSVRLQASTVHDVSAFPSQSLRFSLSACSVSERSIGKSCSHKALLLGSQALEFLHQLQYQLYSDSHRNEGLQLELSPPAAA